MTETLLHAGRLPDQRYRSLADSMPQMVWATDADGRHFYYNRRWYEFTGLSEADSLGFGFANALHPDDKARTLERWQAAWRDGESYEIEYRFRRHDGVYHWFIGRAEPLRAANGQIVEWVGTCTDIHDQKRTAETQAFLAEASKLLASSLDYEETLARVAHLAVPHIADWCAVDILDANGEVRRLAAAHIDPAKVALAEDLARRYPFDPNAASGVAEVLRSGRSEMLPVIPEELVRASISDPELLEIFLALGLKSSMVVPLVARGRTLGAITLVAAESGRHFAAADLTLAEDLAQRAAVAVDNAELYRELRASEQRYRELAETLEARNRELDQFAYVTSHDLKAPLRGIANLAQWVEEDLGTAVTDEARQHLDLLRGRVNRMEGLIDGILQYSRVGRVTNAVERVNVAELVDDVVDLLAPPDGVSVTVEPGLPILSTERLPLRQVFQNLISNAIKHAGPDVQIAVRCRDRGDCYEFAVADSGPGVPPQYHQRIFGIFQTLASRDKVEGSGLGLALIKKIVEHHRGRVWLESPPGTGATFFFTWPKEHRVRMR